MKIKLIVVIFLFLSIFQNGIAQDDAYKFRLTANSGFGYRFSRIGDQVPEDQKALIKELRSGFSFDISAGYFVDTQWGLGVFFSSFNAKGSNDIRFDFEDGSFDVFPVTGNQTITYIGPQYFTKTSFGDGEHSLFGSASLGYLRYKDRGTIAGVTIETVGQSVGYAIGMGYEYRVSELFALGAKLDVIGGSIGTFEQTFLGQTSEVGSNEENLDGGLQREGMTRADIMVGVRFYL